MNTHIKATIANIFMLDQLKKAFGSMLVVKENELWMCSLQLKQNIKIFLFTRNNMYFCKGKLEVTQQNIWNEQKTEQFYYYFNNYFDLRHFLKKYFE